MKYEFLENVAIADIAFRAYGESIEELFRNAGLALTSCMVDLLKITGAKKKELSIKGKNEEELLYNFLEELVYIKDVDNLLFRKFDVKMNESKTEMKVACYGNTLEEIGRGNLDKDVKAITMHNFSVKENNGKWVAEVVVDI